MLIFQNQFGSDLVNKKLQFNLLSVVILLPEVDLDDYWIFQVSHLTKKSGKISLLRRYKEIQWKF